MTDREVQLAIFKAIGALYERMTGERLTVSVGTPAGYISIVSDGVDLPAAAGAPSCPQPKAPPTPHGCGGGRRGT